MKKIKLIAMVIPLLFACTPDTDTPTDIPTSKIQLKMANKEPSNPANPYDNAGAIRNRILESTLEAVPKGSTYAEFLASLSLIANSYTDFQTLKTPSYSQISTVGLQGYMQSTATPSQAAASLPLSHNAQVDFAAFTEGLLSQQHNNFESIQEYILGFEANVLGGGAYSEAEMKLLLTVASLERYAAYYRKKPKDKDWDLLIGNIVAGAQGTDSDTATAILNSVGVEAALHLNLR